MLFRCDATKDTGLGHLSRCLALAEAFQDLGHESYFAGHYESAWARGIQDAGFSITEWNERTGSREDAAALASLARALGVHDIVADDYRISSAWLDRLYDEGWMPVLFDDYGRLPAYGACRGIINYGVGDTRLPYHGLRDDQILFGPRYFPARRELAAVRATRSGRHNPKGIQNILITLGGLDRHGKIWQVLQAVSGLAPDAVVRAAVAPAFMHSGDAEPFRKWLVPFTPYMAGHFAWADACISGGGQTKYECAYVGLPVAILAQTSDEQMDTAVFAAEGLGYDLGGFAQADRLKEALGVFIHQPDLRQVLSQNGLERFPPDSPLVTARAVLSWTSQNQLPSMSGSAAIGRISKE